MLNELFKFNNSDNSVNELIRCVRQGIPSAVFGVTDAFKNLLVSGIEDKVLYIVNDAITARSAVDQISELSGKTAVYIPPKDEILLTSRAFSKDNLYTRIEALSKLRNADVVIVTAETLMQTAPKKMRTLMVKKDVDLNQTY